MVVTTGATTGFRHPLPARVRGSARRYVARAASRCPESHHPGGRDRRLRPAPCCSGWVVRANTCCGGVEDQEETDSILMFGILAVTALLAEWINLPGIVGTFLAGLAV